jgi:hypothetical protein
MYLSCSVTPYQDMREARGGGGGGVGEEGGRGGAPWLGR